MTMFINKLEEKVEGTFTSFVKLTADTQLRGNRNTQITESRFSVISNRTMGRNTETFLFKVNVLLYIYIYMAHL